jgi:23S rRNA (pseudouridine1915-N3)-methyltransferase
MKWTLLTIGKTQTDYLKTGIAEYQKRLSHFIDLDIVEIPDLKHAPSVSSEERSQREGMVLLEKYLQPKHSVILLDETGKEFSSRDFSSLIEKRVAGGQDVVFVIAGPYGASASLKARADAMLSLSQMTFAHEMVRLFFLEQLYRSFAIINHLPYHHD